MEVLLFSSKISWPTLLATSVFFLRIKHQNWAMVRCFDLFRNYSWCRSTSGTTRGERREKKEIPVQEKKFFDPAIYPFTNINSRKENANLHKLLFVCSVFPFLPFSWPVISLTVSPTLTCILGSTSKTTKLQQHNSPSLMLIGNLIHYSSWRKFSIVIFNI